MKYAWYMVLKFLVNEKLQGAKKDISTHLENVFFQGLYQNGVNLNPLLQ